jgi:hypothetical protein
VPISEFVTFEDLSSHIHPADRDRIKAGFAATEGIVNRIMFGIFIDVTGRKQAEEGDELLAGEMSHRVKNLLAIASGLTAITSRSAKTTMTWLGNLPTVSRRWGARTILFVLSRARRESSAARRPNLGLACTLMGAFSGRVASPFREFPEIRRAFVRNRLHRTGPCDIYRKSAGRRALGP